VDLRAELHKAGRDPAVADALLRGESDAVEPRFLAMLDYARKLTRTPSACGRGDLEELRQFGFSDLDLVDAVQVCSYFNYINRIADALGVDMEPDMPDPAETTR
jgi:uncharacterized peroxidase-related enzyme